jgi:hypothetical protein
METTVEDKTQFVCRLPGLRLAFWFRVRANLWFHGFYDPGHFGLSEPRLTDLGLAVGQVNDQGPTEPSA